MKSAADLRDRITVQSIAETRDASGQPVPAWADEATVWGLYEPLGGVETEGVGGQTRSTVTGRVWVRYRADLSPKKRLVVNGYGCSDLTLNVTAVMRPDPETGLVVMLVREPDSVREPV